MFLLKLVDDVFDRYVSERVLQKRRALHQEFGVLRSEEGEEGLVPKKDPIAVDGVSKALDARDVPVNVDLLGLADIIELQGEMLIQLQINSIRMMKLKIRV